MTIAVDLGRKATKQKKQKTIRIAILAFLSEIVGKPYKTHTCNKELHNKNQRMVLLEMIKSPTLEKTLTNK